MYKIIIFTYWIEYVTLLFFYQLKQLVQYVTKKIKMVTTFFNFVISFLLGENSDTQILFLDVNSYYRLRLPI